MDSITISTVLAIAAVSSIASAAGTVAVLKTEITWLKDNQRRLMDRVERLEHRA